MSTPPEGYHEVDGPVYVKDGFELAKSRKEPGMNSLLAFDSEGNVSQALVGEHGASGDAVDTSFSIDDGYERAISRAPVVDFAPPKESNFVPIVIAGAVGIAVAAAGIGVLHRSRQRAQQAAEASGRSSAALPAGWYEMTSDPSRLRFWDGAAWTEHVMSRQAATVAQHDWYPDPWDSRQWRYWDGNVWTHHVAPMHQPQAAAPGWYTDPSRPQQQRWWDGTAWTYEVAPAQQLSSRAQGWYDDPGVVGQLRWWDGTVWTQHVAPAVGAGPLEQAQPVHTPAAALQPAAATEERITMTAEEWRAHVEAWTAAGAIREELWRRLSMADIRGADPATLAAQRQMEELTSAQAAAGITRMLEANPGLRSLGLADLLHALLTGTADRPAHLPDGGPATLDHRR